uniref:Uncharacterized protein n=1 Tax=Anguilla anguilla TaxID=7936 RepID=A0A0E9XGM1_ANGAN
MKRQRTETNLHTVSHWLCYERVSHWKRLRKNGPLIMFPSYYLEVFWSEKKKSCFFVKHIFFPPKTMYLMSVEEVYCCVTWA